MSMPGHDDRAAIFTASCSAPTRQPSISSPTIEEATMDLELTGKIVLVTGGLAGIGAAISHRLACEGAVPVIVDRDENQNFIQSLQSIQPETRLINADLTDEASCRHAVNTACDIGPIHGLVNNAGMNDRAGLDAGLPAFVRSLQRNLLHYYLMTHLCAAQLKANHGAIVNIASKTALTGQGGTSRYCAANG